MRVRAWSLIRRLVDTFSRGEGPSGAGMSAPRRSIGANDMGTVSQCPRRSTIEEIVDDHGPVMFHQSGGCCDGPRLCAMLRRLPVGDYDVKMGDRRRAVHISGSQYEAWKHTDIASTSYPPRGMFSFDNGREKRLVRSECARSRRSQRPEPRAHRANCRIGRDRRASKAKQSGNVAPCGSGSPRRSLLAMTTMSGRSTL